MYAVRRWYFHRGETAGAVARLYSIHPPTDKPNGTDSIHFCCDKYARSRLARQFEINEHYTVPHQQDLFSVSPNKAGLLNLLCERWSDEEQLGGGFKEETKSVLVYNWYGDRSRYLVIITQQEADTTFHYTVFRRKISNELSFTQMTQTLSLCVLRFNDADRFV